MMNLVSINPGSDAQSVEPALVFDVTFSLHRGKEVPLGFALSVRSEDGRRLGVARATASRSTNTPDTMPLDAGAPDNPWQWVVQAVLPLTPRLLDHIENVRAKHRKRDVILQCEVEAHWLTSKVVIAPLKPTPEHGVKYEDVPSGQFYSQTSNMWVLSGDGRRTFLEREKLYSPTPVTIRASDWVHDYLAGWNSTRFVVVELPQAEALASPVPNVADRVNGAIQSIHKASENVAKGEWNDVLEDLRPVWELLRNDADIQGLLSRDGYTPEAVAAFNESVKQQFTLASKFVHRTDTSGKKVSPEIRATKEDALMCYSFAMSLVNLVSRKALRLAQPPTP